MTVFVGDGDSNTLAGGIGGDTLVGGGGSDSLEGLGGNDVIRGDETVAGGGSGFGLTETAAGYLNAGNALIGGLGGSAGFGENFVPRNDDGSTTRLDVSSVFTGGLNFFGTTFTSFFLNNNGNVTFVNPQATFTPFAITGNTSNPMIAAYFGDVDTRNANVPGTTPGGGSTGTNLVYYDFDDINHVFTATWDDVGYFASHNDLLSAFQLQIIDRGNGDFDFIFRYETINWTTGDASGGRGGVGGTISRAGYTSGNGVNFFELPQSGDQAAMLDLENLAGNTGRTGVWAFQVRNGAVSAPGSDTIDGGDGSDTLDGDDAGDLLLGGNGNDLLLGGAGADTVDGGADDDHVDGGDGDDSLTGGDGNDTLAGGEGVDTLDGGLGDDSFTFATVTQFLAGTVVPGGGNDTVTMGDGAETVTADDAFLDALPEDATVVVAAGRIDVTAAVEAVTLSGDTVTLQRTEDPDSTISFQATSIALGNISLAADPAGDATTAVTLAPGSGLIGALEAGNDHDWFAATLRADIEYAALVEPGPNGEAFTGDARVTIRDGDGELIATATGEDGGAALLTFTLDEAGDYFVEVEGAEGGETGSYRLRVVDAAALEPVVSIAGGAAVEGNGGARSINFVISISAPQTVATETTYAILAGSATDGVDFTAGTGSVTIPAGATQATLSVPVSGDLVLEGDETLFVTLSGVSGPFNVSLANRAATGVIVNDDALTPIAVTGVTTTGDSAANAIDGGASGDQLSGGGGNDTLSGLDGSDLVNGGLGDDLLHGGADGDRILGGDGADTVDAGTGSDTLIGDLGRDMLVGGDGMDTIFGGVGDDVLFGGADADSIWGSSGVDFLFGEGGADSLDGGSGDDRVHVQSGMALAVGGDGAFDVLVLLDNAISVVDFGAAANQNGSSSGPVVTGFEALDASASAAAVAATGAVSNGFGNVLFGSAFADTLTGSAAADLLFGNGGADVIAGGDGNDTLFADAGNDTLSGGNGADDFFYPGAQAGAVRITDFDGAEDRVLLGEGLGLTAQAALQQLAQAGADVVLSFASGGSIVFAGRSVASFAAEDFLVV